MRKPIFAGIARDPLGLAVVRSCAIHREAPDVPSARAIGIDVNPFSIGRIVRTIVKAGARSQPLLFSASGRHSIDVEISAALSYKSQPFPIRRPAVEVARDIGSDHLRTGPIGGGHIHLRSISGSMLCRERQTLAVWRERLV